MRILTAAAARDPHSHGGALSLALGAAMALAGCDNEPDLGKRPVQAGASASTESVTPDPANITMPGEPQVAPAPDGGAAIPAAYHGVWDESAGACARPASEMRLLVEGDRLLFHETEAQVLRVRGADGDAIVADVRSKGEGQVSQESLSLRMTPGGQLALERGASAAMRVRCPAG